MLYLYLKIFSRSSGQDGGIGRNALLPHTIEGRITTNLKTINIQKCQKIKLHGTPTAKELKKHSPRLVGGAEAGSWVERTHGKVEASGLGEVVAGGAGGPTFVCR